MAYIWSYLKRYPNWLWLDLLGAMLFVTVILGMPTALAGMIDNGVTKGDRTGVYLWTFIMFIFVVLGIIGRITMAYASSRLTTTMIRDMRNDMYAKLQEYSHHEYEQIGVSSLVTRMTSDTFVLMQFAEMSLRLGLVTPMVMIFSVVMILITSPSLAWLVAVAMPLLVGVVLYVAIKTKPLSERQQTMLDKINQYVRENLTGLRVVRAFARENFQSQKFQVANQRYTDTSTGLFKLTGLTEPLFVQIIIAMIVAIVWFALDPLQRGAIKIGDLVAFIEYSFHALFSFLLFANLFTMYPRMVVSSHRIREVMDMPISINPNAEGVTDTKLKGHLEFDNVTFAYPGETESPVLHDISFKAKPGETIAFIGSTGSGKSSLVNLIPRLTGLINGMVSLARFEEQPDISMVDLDFSHITKDAAEDFKGPIIKDGKDFIMSIQPGIHVKAEEKSLFELVTLLVDNANKYCDPMGTVTVKLSRSSRLRRAKLEVSNTYKNGKDIDYSKFFERFYREDESHNNKKSGYGIGLSIVTSLVHLFKGSIDVNYKHDTITFVIYI
ncbi:TPA: ABC transporter transmembrane domain-containing protein [Streptococcus agalactiae]